jgi:hypothetical protein
VTRRGPRTGYEGFPTHPLHRVPYGDLDAAREGLRQCVHTGIVHIDPEDVAAVADAVLIEYLTAIQQRLRDVMLPAGVALIIPEPIADLIESLLPPA